MDNYEYDAYFSYKRDPQHDAWHEEVKTKLEYWLKQELSRGSVKVFFDREEINTGDYWELKIRYALKHSRCLVCIWSGDYFRSEWCMSELKSFREREGKLNLGIKRLIVPASYHDGEFFPEYAKEYQIKDFSPYAFTGRAFWKTKGALAFERELKAFAKDLAVKIKNSPAYDEQFPIVRATKDDLEQEPTIPRPADY